MKPGVLLVDDDMRWLRIWYGQLPQTHYTLETSDSIESALGLLSTEAFAVVVADIRMPGASGDLGGFELLDRIKDLRLDTRVVMITAYVGGLRDRVNEALGRGAHNFLKKSLDFQELDDCIVDAIDYWRQIREIRKLIEEESDSIVGEHEAKGDVEPSEPPLWNTERQRESWQSQLAQHRWNLARLEERSAEYGPLAVPLEVLSAIEKEKRAISELESKLCGLGGDNF